MRYAIRNESHNRFIFVCKFAIPDPMTLLLDGVKSYASWLAGSGALDKPENQELKKRFLEREIVEKSADFWLMSIKIPAVCSD